MAASAIAHPVRGSGRRLFQRDRLLEAPLRYVGSHRSACLRSKQVHVQFDADNVRIGASRPIITGDTRIEPSRRFNLKHEGIDLNPSNAHPGFFARPPTHTRRSPEFLDAIERDSAIPSPPEAITNSGRLRRVRWFRECHPRCPPAARTLSTAAGPHRIDGAMSCVGISSDEREIGTGQISTPHADVAPTQSAPNTVAIATKTSSHPRLVVVGGRGLR